MLQTQAVEPSLLELLTKLMGVPAFSNFVLVGGTISTHADASGMGKGKKYNFEMCQGTYFITWNIWKVQGLRFKV